MGRDPLVLQIADWKLQIDVSDGDVRVCIITDDDPASYRYVRLSIQQGHELREYLDKTLSGPVYVTALRKALEDATR